MEGARTRDDVRGQSYDRWFGCEHSRNPHATISRSVFEDYARFGIQIAILVTAAGMVMLLLLRQGGLGLRGDEVMASGCHRLI